MKLESKKHEAPKALKSLLAKTRSPKLDYLPLAGAQVPGDALTQDSEIILDEMHISRMHEVLESLIKLAFKSFT